MDARTNQYEKGQIKAPSQTTLDKRRKIHKQPVLIPANFDIFDLLMLNNKILRTDGGNTIGASVLKVLWAMIRHCSCEDRNGVYTGYRDISQSHWHGAKYIVDWCEGSIRRQHVTEAWTSLKKMGVITVKKFGNDTYRGLSEHAIKTIYDYAENRRRKHIENFKSAYSNELTSAEVAMTSPEVGMTSPEVGMASPEVGPNMVIGEVLKDGYLLSAENTCEKYSHPIIDILNIDTYERTKHFLKNLNEKQLEKVTLFLKENEVRYNYNSMSQDELTSLLTQVLEEEDKSVRHAYNPELPTIGKEKKKPKLPPSPPAKCSLPHQNHPSSGDDIETVITSAKGKLFFQNNGKTSMLMRRQIGFMIAEHGLPTVLDYVGKTVKGRDWLREELNFGSRQLNWVSLCFTKEENDLYAYDIQAMGAKDELWNMYAKTKG